jgi:phospholipid-translocating ATPase
MCLVSGIISGVFASEGATSADFFEFGTIGGTAAKNGVVTFWTCVILFQNLVPISLYISIEIVKTAQVLFIYSDIEMYYEKLDYPCVPKSWNISDDLGQIEYIFSDKTGTLTQNVMEFKKCSINGVSYGEAYTEAMAGMQKRQGVNTEEEGVRLKAEIAEDREKMLHSLRKVSDNPYLDEDLVTFVSSKFVADLSGQSGGDQKEKNEEFMLALGLCHSVLTETISEEPPRIEFKAQSPDEAALVATARDMGWALVDRTQRGVILNIQGARKEYEVLNILEFNSSRKRMSAIVRLPETGRIVLFCKGADNVIYSRLAKFQNPDIRDATLKDLDVFASEGIHFPPTFTNFRSPNSVYRKTRFDGGVLCRME